MKKLFILFPLVLLITACGQEPGSVQTDAGAGDVSQPRVVASNYPLWFFANEIAAGSIDVVLPEIEGDPAMWRPGPEGIELLQSADRILLNGAGYESWLNWISLPANRLVDTSIPIEGQLIPLEQETVHQHGPDGEHTHTGYAFTTWLDPELAIAQAHAVAAVLDQLAPEHSQQHQENLSSLQQRLENLHTRQQQAFSSLAGQPVLFSHPVYQYLERQYDLAGYSIHWEPEQEPGDKAWIDFANTLRDHPARIMVWEDEPLPAVRDRLESRGLTVIPYLTASNRPAQGDYFDVMTMNLEYLRTVRLKDN